VERRGKTSSLCCLFRLYFPAGIGILTGANNVSGDLKDPKGAIPKGTILAIVVMSISYAIVAIKSRAGATKRKPAGIVAALNNVTFLATTSITTAPTALTTTTN
jgi:hypothetical protein